MRILVINGPNINMLGIREPHIYGTTTYDELVTMLSDYRTEDCEVECFQSNHEGDIVDAIQLARLAYDGIVINPAAYTHTSVALLDALEAVQLPTVEVHISDPTAREEFRHHSYVSYYAEQVIRGHGIKGYTEAIDYLLEHYSKTV